MAEELQMQEVGKGPRKRNIGHKKGNKGKKKQKVFQGSGQKVKMDGKTKKLFRKRARDYNSDNSDDDDDDDHHHDVDEEEPAPPMKFEKKQVHFQNEEEEDEKSSDEDVDVSNEVSDDEDGTIQPGIMKFFEGNTSFKKAFKKIIKRSGSDDVLGPVLSAHKKLVVKKLAEDAAEKKVKGDAKKEKNLLGEKGHVKPDAFSVSHEKLLMGIATKGVVKLFNAVNKAQSSQKGLNPSRSKDAKVIQKRRKEAFFSELGKQSSNATVSTSGEGPGWAPLRDNYMLTTSKLKDWDKAADAPEAIDDFGRQEDSSSDDDE
ncbi:hypothetical protein L2E82_31373 [Cichorium intybus]|uniref:Uncharacterized protein n=1 Tax=Cichorium intybus TaxID=13427 RepID=A0ACB9D3C0_CICIN|nr:hypothetical protein L2E82_31373 [Cichorium intybus]